MSFVKRLSDWLLPGKKCIICSRTLQAGEEEICTHCLAELPFTQLADHEENKLEKYFWELIPIEHATSLFVYYQGARSHKILQSLKYRKHPQVGVVLGRMMAKQLEHTSFFDTIDMIVPVPLANDRHRQRGYNQAEMIARGLSEIIRLPIITEGIRRNISNVSQTQLSRAERVKNVENIFSVDHPERFVGKHLLLVDDVVTTASTLISLARAFGKCEHIRFSILTLAMSASITEVPYYQSDSNIEENQEGEIIMLE